MTQNEPQRQETPPGPSPNSPSLPFEYQCRSGNFIRLANRIESKKIDSAARIESNRIEIFFARIGMLYSIPVEQGMTLKLGLIQITIFNRLLFKNKLRLLD